MTDKSNNKYKIGAAIGSAAIAAAMLYVGRRQVKKKPPPPPADGAETVKAGPHETD